MVWNAALPAVNTQLVASPAIFNTNQLSIAGVLTNTNLTNLTPYIPTSAPMFMYANVAPTGWTLQGGISDCLLAVKGGSSAYNVSGGSVVGTWNGPAYALIANQLPNISVPVTVWDGNTGTTAFGGGAAFGSSGIVTLTINSGGGMTHEHDWTATRPYAAVGVICSKDA